MLKVLKMHSEEDKRDLLELLNFGDKKLHGGYTNFRTQPIYTPRPWAGFILIQESSVVKRRPTKVGGWLSKWSQWSESNKNAPQCLSRHGGHFSFWICENSSRKNKVRSFWKSPMDIFCDRKISKFSPTFSLKIVWKWENLTSKNFEFFWDRKLSTGF